MNIKKLLKRKIGGYAITFEVIMTLWTMSIIMTGTAYILSTLNTQRYMDTILTSTVIEISKWGGTNSNAYKANNFQYNLIANAQDELNRTAGNLSPIITGGPDVVTVGQPDATCTLSWTYPSLFFMPSIHKTLTISIESIMKPGKLLGGSN